MPQIFVSPASIQDQFFHLNSDESHHVARVLRKKIEDEIFLFDGTGAKYLALITDIQSSPLSVRGKIINKMDQNKSPLYLRLFQGLPKGSKFDFVIEKAVELGVDEIIPYLSDKSLIKLSKEQSESKLKRWQPLVLAACKQSGQTKVPKIHTPILLKESLHLLKEGRSVVFSDKMGSVPFRGILEKFKHVNSQEKIVFNLIVGPESGLTDKEIKLFSDHGADVASLGELTLRTETAGLAAVAIVRYEFDFL
jgi:16S rRNA (uracil1498-N3)-methyltransferase